MLSVPDIVDYTIQGSKRIRHLYVATQETASLDPNSEYMKNGSIFRISFMRNNLKEPVKLKITHRDEYPFHPVLLRYFKKDRKHYLIVVNRVIKKNYVIEIFQLYNRSIQYIKRIHTPLLRHPSTLYPLDNGTFFVLNEIHSIFKRKKPGIVYYSDQSGPVNTGLLGSATDMVQLAENQFLVTVKNKFYLLNRDATSENSIIAAGQTDHPIRKIFYDEQEGIVVLKGTKKTKNTVYRFRVTNGIVTIDSSDLLYRNPGQRERIDGAFLLDNALHLVEHRKGFQSCLLK